MDVNRITYFGMTDARGKKVPFGIKTADRWKHMYVIGKTGMGKSTLLENLAIQDIQNGEGLAFVDPHGKSAELLLDYIPEHRVKDVLYVAPFDLDYPISFNILEDVGPDRRHLVVSGLMSTFEKIWEDAWSARMSYILQNTLRALLEYPGATLLGVNRMLVDKDYRKRVVDNVTDPTTRSFWIDEFAKYTDRYTAEATPAIQNKIGQFAANPLIRNIIGQPKSNFNFREMMDSKKIVIINLSKGKVGEDNAMLLGSMLVTKIYLSAMSRADVANEVLNKLAPFYLYVDEFQSFANKSFADILSEARKYKLSLTLAHQYIEQMPEEVRAAVFGNVGTMITFRVGAFDAEVLEKEFAPQFTAEDLVNLGFTQIYLKLMIDGVSSQPFSATTMPPIEQPAVNFKDAVIQMSRSQYAHARAVVEADIKTWHEPMMPEPRFEIPRERKPEGEHRPPNGNATSSASSNTNSAERRPREERRERPVKAAESTFSLKDAIASAQKEKEKTPALSPEAPKPKEREIVHPPKRSIHSNAKGPSEKNLNGLRAALAAVIQSSPTKVESQPVPSKPEVKHPEPQVSRSVIKETTVQHTHREEVRTPIPNERITEPPLPPPPEPRREAPEPPKELPKSKDEPIPIPPKKPREVPEDLLRQVLETEG